MKTNAITAQEPRPRVNALAPHIRPGNQKQADPNTHRTSMQVASQDISKAYGSRPSAMQVIEYQGSFQASSVNFVEQNKKPYLGSKVTAAHRNNYDTGKLPYLGLSKYTADDLQQDKSNPYSIQPNTEKMLVMRELEREIRQLNKFEKDTLKVHEKPIATRIDRTGYIKEVQNIAASKPKKTDAQKRQQLALKAQGDDPENAQNRQKLNIFDA